MAEAIEQLVSATVASLQAPDVNHLPGVTAGTAPAKAVSRKNTRTDASAK
jgi:hypothetical protein